MSVTPAVMDQLLSQLNEQQREAVCAGPDPLLIIAGAGTGKTTTLAHRVAYLILNGIDPRRILLLTFSRRAAAEMLRRVDGIFRQMSRGPGQAERQLSGRKVCGGTFHAIATRLLRQHGRLIGLNPEFLIHDRGDSEDLMNVVRGELELAKTNKRFPMKSTCLDIYSRCINTQTGLEEILEKHFPWCVEHAEALKELFRAYVDRKEASASLDYDDLLVFWHALAADERGGPRLRDKFDCVLVDEYQDTNVLQAAILRELCPDGQGLTVVGDDAQSIYSFRAATVRNILDFPEQYPGTRVIALEENYRSTQPILDATNSVITQASERFTKNLWSQRPGGQTPAIINCLDEDEQTDFIIDQILAHRESGIALQQQAVLFRASHHSLALEAELARRNIPYHKYGGLKFIETAHIKDMLAFLRLAENPLDTVAGMRVLALLPGIGNKRAQRILSRLLEAQGNFSAWDDFQPPAATAEIWPDFVRTIKGLARRTSQEDGVAADIHQVRQFYAPLLENRYDHAQSRLRDLEQLEQVAARFSSRASFLTELVLDPPSSTQDLADDPILDDDYLILSTIHSAKGLEWDAVYILHAADGNIPSDMATKNPEEIEEERRLFYVALTRAKDWLYVCHPCRYYFPGRYRDAHSYARLTRFLPVETKQYFHERMAGIFHFPDEGESASTSTTTENVRKRVKDMWS